MNLHSPFYAGTHPVSALVLLSLASLVAVSTSSGLALLIGLTSWVVLLISTLVLCVISPVLRKEALLLNASSAFTMAVVAALLSCIVAVLIVILQLFRYEATLVAGIWLPLIASNALIYMHLLAAWEQTAGRAVKTACWSGAYYCAALTVLAVLREFLSSGTVLSDLHLLNPAWSESGIVIIRDYPHLSLFSMVCGGLVVAGLLLALINSIRLAQPALPDQRLPTDEKRVRVTGRIP
jgi:Na+-translocating ferredoxin:NAD+ oxidoreductase RnfE subunit